MTKDPFIIKDNKNKISRISFKDILFWLFIGIIILLIIKVPSIQHINTNKSINIGKDYSLIDEKVIGDDDYAKTYELNLKVKSNNIKIPNDNQQAEFSEVIHKNVIRLNNVNIGHKMNIQWIDVFYPNEDDPVNNKYQFSQDLRCIYSGNNLLFKSFAELFNKSKLFRMMVCKMNTKLYNNTNFLKFK